MFTRTKGLLTLALALTIPLAACDSSTDTAQAGTVSLKLTDANGDEIQEAWVTFTDIYLQGGYGEDATMEPTRVYLMQDGLEEYELTSLAGAVADLVTDATVPAGSYGQLRVVLGDACIVTPEGVFSSSSDYTQCGDPTGVINLTSTDTSGWKVQLNGLVVNGDQQVILLDFVVNQSFFKQTGNANRYNLHPVIKGANISLTGGFDLTLSDPDALLPDGFDLSQFNVTMTPSEGDAETVAFTDDDTDGVWEAGFDYELPGLTYELTLTGPDGLDFTVQPSADLTKELASGQMVTIDWVITSAAAQ